MAATTDIPVTAGQPLRYRRAMWNVMIVLCLVGAAAVLRRMTALAHPPNNIPAQLAGLDEAFWLRRSLTLLHILPALALVILIPFQFSRSFRSRHVRAHRWMGRTALVLSIIIGLSALGLLRDPIGGALEVACILIFDALFLFGLVKAFLHIRRREIALHREWMIRAMSVALGVATVRPIMGLFFATSRISSLTPHDFFGVAFFIGFSLTYLAGEWWIRYTRPAMRAQTG